MNETDKDAAPAHRQYIAVKYRPGDQRTYTYHNDGDRCEVGEIVKVEGRQGWQRVEVVAVDIERPTLFETKPIGGKLPPPELQPKYEGPTDGAN